MGKVDEKSNRGERREDKRKTEEEEEVGKKKI